MECGNYRRCIVRCAVFFSNGNRINLDLAGKSAGKDYSPLSCRHNSYFKVTAACCWYRIVHAELCTSNTPAFLSPSFISCTNERGVKGYRTPPLVPDIRRVMSPVDCVLACENEPILSLTHTRMERPNLMNGQMVGSGGSRDRQKTICGLL